MTQDPHNPYIFHVPSTSEPDKPRRVEIDALDGWGDCACAGHDMAHKAGDMTRHQLAEKKIGKPSKTWCCHIKSARKEFCEGRARKEAQAVYDKVYAEVFAACVEAIRPR